MVTKALLTGIPCISFDHSSRHFPGYPPNGRVCSLPSGAEDGLEFGFDLESRLNDGCVIYQINGFDYIVRQLPETVYRLEIDTPELAAMVAWKVGNLHLPTQILKDAILVLHDEAMQQLLDREGWEYRETECIFNPMKAIAHEP